MTDRPRVRRALLVVLCVVLSVLLYFAFRGSFRHGVNNEEIPPPMTGKVFLPADSPAHAQVVSPPLNPDTLSARRAGPRPVVHVSPPAMRRHDSLGAELEVLEFIRDFYGDVKERTVALRLTGSRLDSTGPGLRVLRGGNAPEEGWPVKRFVLVVDSVRPLRKYVFPGWSYGSDWAPIPDGGDALEGRISPVPGMSVLAEAGEKARVPPEVERKNDRVSVRLRSVPGHSYFVRFGLECGTPGKEESAGMLFTEEAVVEFPSVLRCGSLSREAGGDTLYIATHYPAAVHEVAVSLPRVPVVAVILDADPDAEWTLRDLTARSDVSVFMNTFTTTAESFVLFDSATALVERRRPDPAFERIVRTHLPGGVHGGGLIEDDPSRPVLYRTDLLKNTEAVASLRRLFARYLRESGRQL
jgi:hypothetical protein